MEFIRLKYNIFERLPNLDHVEAIDGKLLKSIEGDRRSVYNDNDRLSYTRCLEPDLDIGSTLIHQKMQVRIVIPR